jgi:DNA replication ATP-dependent helicase Dna2
VYSIIILFIYVSAQVRCLQYQYTAVSINEVVQEVVHTISLEGDWYNSTIISGDIFHIIFINPSGELGCFYPFSTQIVVSDQKNLIIIHPDKLISPTRLSDSISCSRRGILLERSRLGGTSKPAVLGSIKHEFIESFIGENLLQFYYFI